MDTRWDPVTPACFEKAGWPLIEGSSLWKGRPPTIRQYHGFGALLSVRRTGCPWRALPGG